LVGHSSSTSGSSQWYGPYVYLDEARKEIMATYEYECAQGHYNIQERPMAEEQTIYTCSSPHCEEALKRIYSAPAAMFKGRGFYSTGG
jgi:predicted nucleic acid-binding Zn ribbon protein